MKKLLFLTLLFGAIATTTVNAQAGDPQTPPAAPTLKQVIEKQAPGLVEKAGLTQAQAEKVIQLNYEMRMQMLNFKDLSDADRSKKVAELRAEKEKKFAEFLSADQIKSMNAYHAEMGKNAPKREVKQ
jgi:hypothetical protein